MRTRAVAAAAVSTLLAAQVALVGAAGAAASPTLHVSIQVSKSRISYDSPVTIKATVVGPVGSDGVVAFIDQSTGSTLWTTQPPSLGDSPETVTMTTSALAPGTRRLVAEYQPGGPPVVQSAAVTVDVAPDDEVTSVQLDTQHDMDQRYDHLKVAGLHRLWSVALDPASSGDGESEDGDVGYPVIAKGRIFVLVETSTVIDGDPEPAVDLDALNGHTGDVLWSHRLTGGSDDFPYLSYDGGQLFAGSDQGLTAFNAATGAIDWRIDGGNGETPTVAYDGDIYSLDDQSAGYQDIETLSEVDGSQIAVRQTSVPIGEGSSVPAVDARGIYFAFSCDDTFALDDATRAKWSYTTGCYGGGASNPVLHGGNLYTVGFDDPGLALSEAHGTVTGDFTSSIPPSFDRSLGLTWQDDTLTALNSVTGATEWTAPAEMSPPVGDGALVFVAQQNGMVQALSSKTGQVLWQESAGPKIEPDVIDTLQVQVNMAVGGDELVVPAGNMLTAFGD